MARRKKFPSQIIVRRELHIGPGDGELQLYLTVDDLMQAPVTGTEVEYAIYGLLETRTRRKS